MTAALATGAVAAVTDDGSRTALFGALGLVFAGLTVVAWLALTAMTRAQSPEERVRRSLSPYSVGTRQPARQPLPPPSPSLLGDNALGRSAVQLAGRVTRSRGLDTAVDSRLEAAGLPLRTAEWLLVHVGVAVLTAVVLLVLSGGGLLATVVGLLLGLAGPWALLVVRQGRRENAFLAQLPDTLQLVAGSLRAGHSLPQALDTVVREGRPPMSGEFNRALIEHRLGKPIEEALEGIGTRMASQDFSWVVMAIRIQREVGGNLAELLRTVGDTIRERERLRRQVQVLSAEGRLSAWILALLPVVFTTYLAIAKPDYLTPMLDNPIGWFLLGLAGLLLAVGAFWTSRAVKVEV